MFFCSSVSYNYISGPAAPTTTDARYHHNILYGCKNFDGNLLEPFDCTSGMSDFYGKQSRIYFLLQEFVISGKSFCFFLSFKLTEYWPKQILIKICENKTNSRFSWIILNKF